jgi:hypothetical protein
MYLSWDVFAVMGITISFFIITIIFMLSYMFNSEFLKSWSKGEFLNIFITLILFGSLLSVMQLDIATNNLQSGRKYVNDLFDDVLGGLIKIISDMSVVSLIGSFSININPSGVLATQNQVESGKTGGGMPVSGYISLNPLVSPIITSFSSLQIYSFIPLLMIKLHILLIDFVADDALNPFPIFLALGIFLRAFKFSRGAGNTMIAIFLALYFILPTIYLFNLAIMNVVYGQYSPENIFKFQSFATGQAKKVAPDMMDVIASSLSDEGTGHFGTTTFGAKLIEMTSPGGSLYLFVMRFIMEGFMLPYLAIIIALAFAREIALTLGTNVDFSSLVRLV